VTPRLPRCFRFVCQWCSVARVIETVLRSRDSSLFGLSADVSLAPDTSGSLEKMCRCDIRALEAPSGPPPRATCAARRARRLPSASRAHPDPDEHGRRVGRRRSLRRPRAPRRAQELRRRRGSPGIGRHARRPPPRSRCVPPRSPRSRRGDAARMPSAMLPSISPARRGGRSEPPRSDARGRPTRHRTDKAIVVRDFRNLDARSRFEPTAASDRAPPSFSRLSRSRTTRILMSSDRIPLFMSSLSLRDEQSRRARPGALSVACSA